jgi:hypothetical protein
MLIVVYFFYSNQTKLSSVWIHMIIYLYLIKILNKWLWSGSNLFLYDLRFILDQNMWPECTRKKCYSYFVQWLWSRGSRDSSVFIAMAGVWFLSGARNLSHLHIFHTRPGAHRDSYPVDTGDYFLGCKATGGWSWPHTQSSAEVKLYPLRHHGVVLN